MGPLINNFVIRSSYSSGKSFHDYLQEIVKASQEAYLNSDVSVDKIINLSGLTRRLSYAPLYQVMFDVVSVENKND